MEHVIQKKGVLDQRQSVRVIGESTIKKLRVAGKHIQSPYVNASTTQ